MTGGRLTVKESDNPPMPDLTDITGVGAATASTLGDHDIRGVEDLAEADPSTIDGVAEAKMEKIVRRAQQELITSKTASDLLAEYESQEYVSTGVDAVDRILDGGWEPETIALAYGQSGTGKTQLVFSTMGSAASEGTVVYLMTELQSKSIADRLRSLSDSVDDLDNIHIYQANDVDEQAEAYEAIAEEYDSIDLLVVDSFTAQFRMAERFDGRENLGDRSAEMGKHLRRLGSMARVYQCPVVMTGQVYSNPDAWGKGDVPYGGNKMEHFISYFVRMTDEGGSLWGASLENHPGVPEDEVTLRIEEDGLVEAEE